MWLTHPHLSLLFFWVERNNQRHVLTNRAYRLIVEESLIPNLNPDGESPFNEDWWLELAFFETFRQALKTGNKIICPFLHWEGVTCTPACPIRNTINQLKEHTELAGKEAICPL